MSMRRKGRELALQMLYQRDIMQQSDVAIEASVSKLRNSSKDAWGFAHQLFKGTVDRIVVIDATIEKSADTWRLDRMATVDRNILRLAVYELMETDTPKPVVINEALETARCFSSADSVAFVNGVLEATCKFIDAAV